MGHNQIARRRAADNGRHEESVRSGAITSQCLARLGRAALGACGKGGLSASPSPGEGR
jgi:hypothetical protein